MKCCNATLFRLPQFRRTIHHTRDTLHRASTATVSSLLFRIISAAAFTNTVSKTSPCKQFIWRTCTISQTAAPWQHGLYSRSLRFNGLFPGEPGLANVYWSKAWWRWWWQLELQVVQSSSQIIITKKPTPSFLQAGCPSCRPTNSVKVLKGKISHSMDLHPSYEKNRVLICWWWWLDWS